MSDSGYLPLTAENIRRVNRVFLRREDRAISFGIHDGNGEAHTVNVCVLGKTGHDDRRLLPNEENSLVFCAGMIGEIDGSMPKMDWDETITWARRRMEELGVAKQPGVLRSELSLPPYIGDILKLLQLFTGKDFSRYELKPPHDDPLFIGEDV